MIVLNPQKLAILLQSQSPVVGEVMDNSNTLANQLIKNLQVQSGQGLAGFLNVDSSLDNFTAVRVWVNKQLSALQSESSDDDITWVYEELEHRFLDCMPELG